MQRNSYGITCLFMSSPLLNLSILHALCNRVQGQATGALLLRERSNITNSNAAVGKWPIDDHNMLNNARHYSNSPIGHPLLTVFSKHADG